MAMHCDCGCGNNVCDECVAYFEEEYCPECGAEVRSPLFNFHEQVQCGRFFRRLEDEEGMKVDPELACMLENDSIGGC